MIFDNRTLLITGGTGSFGSAVLKRFLDTGINEIRVFSRDEKKQNDMREQYKNKKIKFYIGDVRDIASIREAVRGVDYIFHAAALKQVPSCEVFPLEAVKTNILGTDNVLTVAIEAGVKKVVCLSTDKAAYPINAMGTSKAMMEKVILAKARTSPSTIICITRYGNVMASRGSVIPLFIKQILNNQPLTVTSPDMTRFMMTLDEAVGLVFFALENAAQGELFIQKSPACEVGTLATALKQIFASEVPIEVIGTRTGDKKHETLLTAEEMSKAIEMEEYFRVSLDGPIIRDDGEYTSDNAERLSINKLIDKLKMISYIKKAIS